MDPSDTDPADRLIAALRTFARGLDADEWQLLEVLLAPGVSLADSDVVGFAAVTGLPAGLPAQLAAGLAAAGVTARPRSGG